MRKISLCFVMMLCGLFTAESILAGNTEKNSAVLLTGNDSPPPKNKFTKLTGQAMTAFKKEDWERALGLFRKALKLKPNSVFQREMALICEEMKAGNKTGAYTIAVRDADQAFLDSNRTNALFYYEVSNFLNHDDDYSRDRMNTCNAILIDSILTENAAINYQSNLLKGDSCFLKKDWSMAQIYYTINDFESNRDDEPRTMYSFCKAELESDSLMTPQIRKEEYEYLMRKGDACFQSSDWENAVRFYELAASVYPMNPYPVKKEAESLEKWAEELQNVLMSKQNSRQ